MRAEQNDSWRRYETDPLCQVLKAHQEETEREMEQRKWGNPFTEHEEVYHAASWRQAASLSLTPCRLHDGKRACSLKGKKRGGFASQSLASLSRCWGMRALSSQEGGRLIALVLPPYGKDDSCPNVGEGAYGFGVTFALNSFSLIVVPGPRFTLRGLPGELMQGIAQRFTTSIASVRFRIRSTLKDDWGGGRSGGKTAGISIAIPIIPNFCQQSGSKAFSCTWKGTEDFLVFMREKKLFDHLVDLRDLLNQWQKLPEQNQHQARFGAGRDGISVAA